MLVPQMRSRLKDLSSEFLLFEQREQLYIPRRLPVSPAAPPRSSTRRISDATTPTTSSHHLGASRPGSYSPERAGTRRRRRWHACQDGPKGLDRRRFGLAPLHDYRGRHAGDQTKDTARQIAAADR